MSMPQLPGLRSRTQSLAYSIPSVNQSAHERATSPTFSTTTAASAMNLPPSSIITRADLRASMGAYNDLVSASANYRAALSTLSHGSARLADALETCARLKGVSDDVSLGLQAASGLHHLIANHEQVLGRALQMNVEDPLRKHLEEYKTAVAERSAAYERSLVERSKIIRQTEMENMNYGRRRQRDLNSFRNALNILQAQVNELDKLKSDYYENVLQHEEQVWDFVLNKVSFSVRSTLDVYDRITAKSSDQHLEPLLLSIPDPFNSYGPPKDEDQIYSILPPLSLATMMANNNTSPATPQMSGSAALPQSIPSTTFGPMFRTGPASPAMGSPDIKVDTQNTSHSVGPFMEEKRPNWGLPAAHPVVEESAATLRGVTANKGPAPYYPSINSFEWADAYSTSQPSSSSTSPEGPTFNLLGRRSTGPSTSTSPSSAAGSTSNGAQAFATASPASSQNGIHGPGNGPSKAESKLRSFISSSTLNKKGDDKDGLKPGGSRNRSVSGSDDEDDGDDGDVWGRTTPVGRSSRSIVDEAGPTPSIGEATPRKATFDHALSSNNEGDDTEAPPGAAVSLAAPS